MRATVTAEIDDNGAVLRVYHTLDLSIEAIGEVVLEVKAFIATSTVPQNTFAINGAASLFFCVEHAQISRCELSIDDFR